MESMGKKPRRRRAFTPEFKAEIVEPCQRGDRSVGQVARDFDLTGACPGPAPDREGRRPGARPVAEAAYFDGTHRGHIR
jgi:hypothetical protein